MEDFGIDDSLSLSINLVIYVCQIYSCRACNFATSIYSIMKNYTQKQV